MTGVSTMSYSRLNTYFECPFKFYMSHMLSADPMDEETVQLRLGTFFHDVLKDYVTLPDDDDALRSALEDRLSAYLSDKKDMPETETFVLIESLGQLFGVIRFIRAIEGDSMFDVDHTEQRVSLPLPGQHIKTLVGTIDKILKAGDESNTYVLIDYKTGSAHHPLVHVKDGLDAQIVFYLLFLMRTKDHPTIAGFYYQNIHTNPQRAKAGKTYQDLLHEKWRLDGYSLDDPDIVRMIDSHHDERNTFAHYRLKKDGTPDKRSWVYDHDTLVNMTADFERLIHQSIKAIEDGKFPVSPATVHASNVTRPGCMYCPFKDVCRLSLKDDRPITSDDPLRADASEREDERDDA
jgi:ATP-dependent helicase/DNAse subunit B